MLDVTPPSFADYRELSGSILPSYGPHQTGLVLLGYLIGHFNYDIASTYDFVRSASDADIIALLDRRMPLVKPMTDLEKFLSDSGSSPSVYRCEVPVLQELSWACSSINPSKEAVRSNPDIVLVRPLSSSSEFDLPRMGLLTTSSYSHEASLRIYAIARSMHPRLQQLAERSPWSFRRIRQEQGDLLYARNEDLFVVFEYPDLRYAVQSSSHPQPHESSFRIFHRHRDGQALDVAFETRYGGPRFNFHTNVPTDLPPEFAGDGWRSEKKYWDGFSVPDDLADPTGKYEITRTLRSIADEHYQAQILRVARSIERQAPR